MRVHSSVSGGALVPAALLGMHTAQLGQCSVSGSSMGHKGKWAAVWHRPRLQNMTSWSGGNAAAQGTLKPEPPYHTAEHPHWHMPYVSLKMLVGTPETS